MKVIKLNIPKEPQFFSSVRLFTSGLLMSYQLDFDKIEDVKVAVNESLNIVMKHQCSLDIDLEYRISEEKVEIQISGFCPNVTDETSEETELAKTIINCLVDESRIEEDKLQLIIDLVWKWIEKNIIN